MSGVETKERKAKTLAGGKTEVLHLGMKPALTGDR